MDRLWLDMRFILRRMRLRPLVPILIVVILSSGVGAATAVFAVVDAVLIRALPFDQARFVALGKRAAEGYTTPWSYLDYVDIRGGVQGFQELVAYNPFQTVNLRIGSEAQNVKAVKSSWNFFDALELPMALGRTYAQSSKVNPLNEETLDERVLVISNEVWREQFASDREVIGKIVDVDGVPYTVIGVLEEGARFPLGLHNAVYFPDPYSDPVRSERHSHWFEVFGSLKRGVTQVAINAEVVSVVSKVTGDVSTQGEQVAIPLAALIGSSRGSSLEIAMFAAFVLLSLACINASGLLLAQGAGRGREIAIRIALGIQRTQIVRISILESVTYAVLVSSVASVVAAILLEVSNGFIREIFTRGSDVRFNKVVFAFSMVITMVTCLVAGALTAIRSAQISPQSALKSGGSPYQLGRNKRLHGILLVCQVSVSLFLLVTASALVRNLVKILSVQICPDPQSILTIGVNIPPRGTNNSNLVTTFYDPLLEKIQNQPGVKATGMIDMLPIMEFGRNGTIEVVGGVSEDSGREPVAEFRSVSEGYFEVFGIHALEGRTFSSKYDRAGNMAHSIVVNEAFARKFLPRDGDALNSRLNDSVDPTSRSVIVGVVNNIRQNVFQKPLPEIDRLVSQQSANDPLHILNHMHIVARTSVDPRVAWRPIRDLILRMDSSISIEPPRTMADIISDALVYERSMSILFASLSGCAILICLVGVYGIVHHDVEMRTKELSVRLALGAPRVSVAWSVLSRATVLLITGIFIGWVLVMFADQLLRSVVVIGAPHDLTFYAILTIMFLSVGGCAATLPIGRVMLLEPHKTLSAE
jgi:predicted permease